MSKRRNADAISMKESMSKFLSAMGIEEKVHETAVLSKWKEIVGVPVEKRTESLRIINKVLHVQLSSSVMRDVLLQNKSLIVARFNEVAGKEMIVDIYLK
jgi:hypothetical protein